MSLKETFRAVKAHDRERLLASGDRAFDYWYFADPDGAARHNGPPIEYAGPEDILRWVQWAKPQPHYFPAEQVAELARRSAALNARILGPLMNGYAQSAVDLNNAIDFLFQTPPMPERYRPRTILDFGAGYGRQANLWTQHRDDLCMVGMDAHESPYLLQHWYYAQLGRPLTEYLDDPDGFRVKDAPGIFHLPSWRHDLLPDDFFDMVLCVHVLQEISEEALLTMLECFKRTLKPGGALFVRDHGNRWQPVHTVDVDAHLQGMGFILEYRPYVRDSYEYNYKGTGPVPDLHGIPRIFRKPCPAEG